MSRVQVLCGCGWGSLAMEEEDVPDECPVCGHPIGDENDDAEDEDCDAETTEEGIRK